MTTEHGDWRFTDHGDEITIDCGDIYGAAVMRSDEEEGGDWPHDQQLANARLIAAAPDMLAACETSAELFGLLASSGVIRDTATVNQVRELARALREDVIAKATGKETG